jgi:hypothetical protein
LEAEIWASLEPYRAAFSEKSPFPGKVTRHLLPRSIGIARSYDFEESAMTFARLRRIFGSKPRSL